MKNAFHFILKALFVLKIVKFLSWLFAGKLHVENDLIRKIRLISKSMMSQPSKKTIAIHIFTNISRSKGNQAMKFSQLIACNIKNIFLEKSCTKCSKKTIPRPFSKKLKLSISLDQYCKVFCILVKFFAKLMTM